MAGWVHATKVALTFVCFLLASLARLCRNRLRNVQVPCSEEVGVKLKIVVKYSSSVCYCVQTTSVLMRFYAEAS